MPKHPRFLLAVFLVTLPCGLALAQPSPAERAAAEALFQDARALSKQGKDAEACPKYDESNRIDPSIGTQLYLADCYEKTGKLASAWVLFKEAASMAQSSGQADREKSASARASALEGRLPKLLLRVADGEIAGLEIRQDGKVVRKAQWGTAIPVDLGPHALQATAPGRKPWSHTAEAREGQIATVNIPALLPEDAAPAAPASAPASAAPAPPRPPADPGPQAAPAGWNGWKTAAVIAAGVGVVGLGAGSYFGLKARSQWDDAKPLCPGNRCNQEGYDLGTSAHRNGNLGTLLLAVGVAGVGAGAVLWFTAPSATQAPAVGVGPGSLVLQGRW